MSDRPPPANIPTLTEVVARPGMGRPVLPPMSAPVVRPTPPAPVAVAATPASRPSPQAVVAAPAAPVVVPTPTPDAAAITAAAPFEATAVLVAEDPPTAAEPPRAPERFARPPPLIRSSAPAVAAPMPEVAEPAPAPSPEVPSSPSTVSSIAEEGPVAATGKPPARAQANLPTPPAAALTSTAAPIAAQRPQRPIAPVAAAAATPAPSEAELVDRVLAHLQRQVDLALEVKLREVLTPLLTRASDSVVREARKELTTVMRDLVSRAISQELARRGKVP